MKKHYFKSSKYHKIISGILLLLIVLLTGCKASVYDEFGYFKEANLNYTELLPTDEEGRLVKNLIFMIGDGMGHSHIEAASQHLLPDERKLDIQKIPYKGEVITNNINGETTDSAASGTAYATGYKTVNKALGKDQHGNNLMNILEYAKKEGFATGIVTTQKLNDATPAAFSAHVFDRHSDDITLQQISSGIDVLIGGGRTDFEKHQELIEKKGYTYINNMDDFNKTKADKIFAILRTSHFMDDKNTPSLAVLTKKAIEVLSKNEKGFILIVEEGLIDTYSHAKNINSVLTKVLEFDKAVRVSLNFARSNHDTLVVVTADHETGGLKLKEGTVSKDWFTTTEHTNVNVPIMAFGLHARGINNQTLENNEVNRYIVRNLGFNNFPSIVN